MHKTFIMFITHIGIWKTRNWFRYKTFYYLFEFKVFRREEIKTQFLQQTRGTFRRPHLVSTKRDQKSTTFVSTRIFNSLFFSYFKILSASAHDNIHVPGSFPIWGFYCDISDCHIRPARAQTPTLNVCT